jgi:DNA-binding LacI/PurR family transcriptional regulator
VNYWFREHTASPLTVVDLPIREMGEVAGDLSVRRMEGKSRERRSPARFSLTVCRSTAPPA